jgi:uncharacterized paraquat-inducible protein A
MPEVVYLLCALTSIACAVLLGRAFRKSRARILLWSTACFVLLALNNLLLFLDLAILGSDVDLSKWRNFTACAAAVVLVFGLIWDSE